MYNRHTDFEFDPEKEAKNRERHKVDFQAAKEVFIDQDMILVSDQKHSQVERRWYAVGRVRDGRIITVWFTRREDRIRIIGAAELRKWRKEYEKRKVARSIKTEMG